MVLIFIAQYLSHVTVHIDLTFDSLYHRIPHFVKYSMRWDFKKEQRHKIRVVALFWKDGITDSPMPPGYRTPGR